MPSFTITVNRQSHRVDADASMPLLWVLRDRLNLTGTKYGCGAGLCGACTVLQDDRAVRSCTLTLAAAAGHSFTTIEGLSPDGTHPCQRAWIEEDVAQCGYCQPGMIWRPRRCCVRIALRPRPTSTSALAGHICRCGTYTRLRTAARRAAEYAK